MTTAPQPYILGSTARAWADRIKVMKIDELHDLTCGLLVILEEHVGSHWKESQDLVKAYRPRLDQVARSLEISADVHAILATAQHALVGIHNELRRTKAEGLLKGLDEGPRLNAARGGRAKAEKSGFAENKAAIKAAWASGKYSSRDVCAEQEAAALGMSFSIARKALRNTPDPA